VLSLACGQGQDARLLAGLGATVTGIDISEEMLRHARRHEAAAPRGDVGGVPGLLYARAVKDRCEARAPGF
jgi:SAM-dependent methyltransferase